jgi:hypothetical protein
MAFEKLRSNYRHNGDPTLLLLMRIARAFDEGEGLFARLAVAAAAWPRIQEEAPGAIFSEVFVSSFVSTRVQSHVLSTGFRSLGASQEMRKKKQIQKRLDPYGFVIREVARRFRRFLWCLFLQQQSASTRSKRTMPSLL